MNRIHNFFPGPGPLPLEVIQEVKNDLENYQGVGYSLLEMSHRTPEYEEVHHEAGQLIRELMELPSDYHVLWLQGGASLQFPMIPMNLLGDGKSADYINTGVWSRRAIREAKMVGDIRIAGSSEEDGYNYIPKNLDLNPDAQYLHLTSNNTIMGTQFHKYPDVNVPLVGDMSSDILSRKVDVRPFGMIFAGAHKNLGPSGATVVIIRQDILEKCKPNLPTLLKYSTYVENDSMFNTPVTFTIYFVRCVLNWIKREGGTEVIEKRNRAKAELFYKTLEESGGFYKCPIALEDRSMMNCVFNLPSTELEDKFAADAKAAGMVGLKNLPQRGGCRVSLYNAVSMESVEVLAGFMKEFAAKNG